jgi:Abortive infection alpha
MNWPELLKSIDPDVQRKLTGFLLRLIGPAGDVADLVGDWIKHARMLSIYKTLQIAQQKADESGVSISRLPIKFLAPFLEKASLEELDSPLCEQWAHLLVNASSSYDSSYRVYVDILDSIGSLDALILRHMWERANEMGFDPVITMVGDLEQDEDWNGVCSTEVLIRSHYAIVDSVNRNLETLDLLTFDEKKLRALLVLQQQNLVTVTGSRHENDDQYQAVVIANLTPLGHAFVTACETIESRRN